VLVGVQKAVYHYEGSVNKFLMDDKGSTLIACFGLSPVSHTDDALRAVPQPSPLSRSNRQNDYVNNKIISNDNKQQDLATRTNINNKK